MTQDLTTYNNDDAPGPRSNQLARRDFSGNSLAVGNSATEALVAKARADTEARWIMAMRRPRNLDDVRQAMLKECRRPGFAEVAVYQVPRGDTKIEGLSIRFAEVAVRCMGNLQPEVVTIYDDNESRIVRCTVTDYESNVTWSKDLSIKKTVERKFLKKGQRSLGERVNSYGDRVFQVEATDDDVATKEAAQVSKALRTLILRCVPGHLQDECLALCNATYADKAAKDPDGERIKVLDAFAGLGVLPSEIEELLGHTTERMAPVELDRLRKLYSAISDGQITWPDALAESNAKAAAAAKAAPPPAAAPTSAPAAPQATNAAPAQQPAEVLPAPAASKPATRNKGTAALKNKLETTGNPDSSFGEAAERARAKEQAREAGKTVADGLARAAGNPEDEPGWMAKPTETVDDEIELPCAGCGVPIAAKKSDPPGGKCYACLNA